MASKSEQDYHTRHGEESEEGHSWWVEKYHAHEVSALLLCGFALMFLLALTSYTPHQLPSWVHFAQPAETASGNIVGPFGAFLAGCIFATFGAAGYLVPVVLLWWALQIATTKRALRHRNLIALGIFIVSAACIADCQAVFFQNWVERYNLPGSAGGFAGYLIGNQVFVRFFGPAGTFIMMLAVAILTLVVITGIHPFRFARMAGRQIAAFCRSIDWEKKWTMWSGVPPKEEVITVTRALPTPKTITVEPILDHELEEEEETAAAAPPPVVEPVPVPTPAPTPAPAAVVEEVPAVSPSPVPERVRNIIDASQRHHSPADPKLNRAEKKQQPFDFKLQYEGYELPSLDILSYAKNLHAATDNEELIETQNHIVSTLNSFKVEVEPGDITKGPTITRYEVYPSPGLRVNKITALKADIARATRAENINILAPIPGKDTVGIEIANSNKITVALRELFETEAFRNSSAKLPLVLGKDVYGNTIVGDLAKMPHLLVAGATGSGKSVCINSIIASLLYRFTPDELKFIMIDPKVVEMQLYNALPHMVVPVVTDPKKVLLALRWVIKEMERRYELFAKAGTRNYEGYNRLRSREARAREMEERSLLQPNLVNTETGEDFLSEDEDDEFGGNVGGASSGEEEPPENLPYIVVIIDELADLMQTAPADVETGIARIAQKARAAGIHLIIATQTPRADVITGIIKANIPSRIAFQVSSKTDSRIILDENGAENLVGKGDMLYLPPGSAQLIRAQGALITDDETQGLVNACAAQGEPHFEAGDGDDSDFGFMEEEESTDVSDADEEIIAKCLEVIFAEKKASTSLLQRRLRLGYTRAARMIDILESRGIIGPGDGAKPREILVDLTEEKAS